MLTMFLAVFFSEFTAKYKNVAYVCTHMYVCVITDIYIYMYISSSQILHLKPSAVSYKCLFMQLYLIINS